MGFHANIDIAVSFSQLKVTSMRQQGLLKYRLCLYYYTHTQETDQKPEMVFCHPYSILKSPNRHNTINPCSHHPSKMLKNPQQIPLHHKNPSKSPLQSREQESEIDLSSDYYISEPFKVQCQRQSHQIMETCCFRTYIDVQDYDRINLKCMVEMMFCSDSTNSENSVYKVIGRCECKIRKVFDISSFFPIVFDQFQGVALEGVYQAALIDFHYQKTEDSQRHNTFYDYLKQITSGCMMHNNVVNRIETRKFYSYYRGLLQKQLFVIQERHYDLIRVLKLHKNAEEEFRMLKINPNAKISNMIDHLEGYNSSPSTALNMAHHYPSHHIRSPDKNARSSNQGLPQKNGPFSNSSHAITSGTTKQKKVVHDFNNSLSEEVLFDFLSIKAHLFNKWQEYLKFTAEFLVPITKKYQKNYNNLVKERLSSHVFSHLVEGKDWRNSAYEDSGREHLKQAEVDKKKVEKDEELWKQSFVIENENFFTKDSEYIKIFEEIYPVPTDKKKEKHSINNHHSESHSLHTFSKYNHNNKNDPLPHQSIQASHPHTKKLMERKGSLPASLLIMEETCEKSSLCGLGENQDHFVVLVHGFQASRQDFMVLKNCLEIRFKVKVYISTINEGRTEDELQVLGKRFALELQRYLNDSSPSVNYKLSFIGHSMGGIIIRSGLCFLENIQRHLFSYITLSTPHLGYLYEPSAHIQAGLWFMNAWQKIQSIEQICMRDDEDLRNSYLYKLSRSKTLNKFKNLVFVGSCQDKYVPYQSARLESNRALIWERVSSSNGQIISQMIDGLIGHLQYCHSISRIDVIFNIEEKNLDAFIGRTAHVKYLSDRQFIKMFCIVFDRFFK